MRKYLLPPDGRFFKANLHNHTVLSDGMKTPEQIKTDYMKNGYSVVAFTDHDRYYSHNDLTDEKFLALNGFELEYYYVPWVQKTAHFCFIAKEPDNPALGYSVPGSFSFITKLHENDLDPEEGGLLYTVECPGRKYTPEYINADIRRAKELGFYITYNHPAWSLESYPDYSTYKNVDAFEISNYGCVLAGYDDDDGRVYDDLLRLGNRIPCIASDDNHNESPDGDIKSDSYGAYTMLAADRLDYASVIRALENGDFYACAKVNPGAGECPEIKNLYIEDGYVHIETSPAANIAIIKDVRPFGIVLAKAGIPVTSAAFKIQTADSGSADKTLTECQWFRIVVTGMNGCKAYTRAYFTDSL